MTSSTRTTREGDGLIEPAVLAARRILDDLRRAFLLSIEDFCEVGHSALERVGEANEHR
jgi:hypothetical protein